MTVEVFVLSDVWRICKEYIPSKDRQAAADHVMGIVSDSLGVDELRELAADDSHLTQALGDVIDDDDYDGMGDDDEDSDY